MKRLITVLGSLASQWLFLWAVALVSMIFSMEFLLSQAMILMVATAVFEWRGGGLHLRSSFLKLPKKLRHEPVWWVFTLPFFIVLFSGLWSEDYGYWLERLRIKLPFLVLPFAFAAGPKFSERQRDLGWYFFLWVMFLACLYVLAVYLSDYQNINESLGRGQAMPTPSNHIRFSLALSFAVFVAVFLAYKKFYWRYIWERKLLWFFAAFFFFFVHFLSVRSGLLSLYAAFIFLAFRQIFSRSSSKCLRRSMAASLVVVFLLPLVAYHFLPAFQKKVDYMRWDLQQYFSGNTEFSSSDADRLKSLEIGWAIAVEHPLAGVGAGDLKSEVQHLYEERYGAGQSFKMPHSQWMTYLAGTGLLGLAVFVFSFFYPLLEKKRYRHFLFSALWVIFFVSLFVENTFEGNFGVSLYTLFALWLLEE